MNTNLTQSLTRFFSPLAVATLLLFRFADGLVHAADRTWNGGGGDDNWTTDGNWVGGAAPLAGDSLFFEGTARLGSSNDFPASTAFNGITFNGPGGFTLTGNSLNLGGNITNNQAVTTERINLALVLSTNCNVNVTDTGSLMIAGDISGAGFGLTKSGNGTLTLSGASTYSGDTVVSNGLLALTTIPPSPVFDIAGATATLDVSAVGGGLFLCCLRTIKGNGTLIGDLMAVNGGVVSPGNSAGTFTVNGNAVLGFNFSAIPGAIVQMEIDKASATTNDVLRCTGNIDFGTVGAAYLSVSNIGPALAAGDNFKLFDAANYAGGFQSVTFEPATPGPNLAWDTSTLVTDGILKVVSTLVPQPKITSIAVSGPNVMITGTNNGSGPGDYYVLTSTNVALAVTNWTSIATNPFDGGGNFNLTLTNAAVPAVSQRYFIIQLP